MSLPLPAAAEMNPASPSSRMKGNLRHNPLPFNADAKTGGVLLKPIRPIAVGFGEAYRLLTRRSRYACNRVSFAFHVSTVGGGDDRALPEPHGEPVYPQRQRQRPFPAPARRRWQTDPRQPDRISRQSAPAALRRGAQLRPRQRPARRTRRRGVRAMARRPVRARRCRARRVRPSRRSRTIFATTPTSVAWANRRCKSAAGCVRPTSSRPPFRPTRPTTT